MSFLIISGMSKVVSVSSPQTQVKIKTMLRNTELMKKKFSAMRKCKRRELLLKRSLELFRRNKIILQVIILKILNSLNIIE